MAGVIAGFFAQYLALIVINNPTGGYLLLVCSWTAIRYVPAGIAGGYCIAASVGLETATVATRGARLMKWGRRQARRGREMSRLEHIPRGIGPWLPMLAL